MKKYLSLLGVGLLSLAVFSPTFAQSVSASATVSTKQQIIQLITQLLQQLEAELQTLLAQQGSTQNQSPSASILTATQVTNPAPYIIGTASGVSQVGIVLAGQYGDKVYASGLIPVVNGNWSVTVSPALALAQYTIYVYDANNNKLTSGPLTIVSPATQNPSIYSLSTTTIPFSGTTNITINGFGFNSSTRVYINGLTGSKIIPTSVSSDGTALTFTLSNPGGYYGYGNISVGVSNDGVSINNLLYLSILNPTQCKYSC